MASFPLIPNGTYRIRSKDLNTYLDYRANNSFATMKEFSPGASQQWTISPAGAGDYEIKCQAAALRVNNLGHLFCSAIGEKFTWTIEPRGSNEYVIGNAANAQAIQLPNDEPVIVSIRNNSTCQRWVLEPNPVSVSGAFSHWHGNTANHTTPRNTLFAGIFAVPGFIWKVEANLHSIADLPIATQMMARGPDGLWTPTEADFEAFQVARWALGCIVQSAVPITHPGGRGNYDILQAVSLGDGWVGRYMFQRLLDIAILHPATRNIPLIHPVGAPGEVPSTLQNATSSWNNANRNLLSFCFRVHQALVNAGAIVTDCLSGITVKGVNNFSWFVQPKYRSLDCDLPDGTRIMARGSGSSSDADFEAYQVARWALRCFEQCAIPITHPGGRGNYDVTPDSIRFPRQSWPCAYIFQRLLDIAALHPASRQIPAFGPSTQLEDLGAPEATRAAVSTWTQSNQRLFSFCFRLHRALLDPNPSLIRPLGTSFDWEVQSDLSIITDLPKATIALTAQAQPSLWTQRDLEALQVARWAISLFSSHGIPITTPGGRGVWDALPSYRYPDDGWAYAHILQRLLEVAALHLVTSLDVPVETDHWSKDIPAELRTATSNWGEGTGKLASFCFRLHRLFLSRFNIEPDSCGGWATAPR